MSAALLREAAKAIRKETQCELSVGREQEQEFYLALADWLDEYAGLVACSGSPRQDAQWPALRVARAYLSGAV